jgi:hypothetical protein
MRRRSKILVAGAAAALAGGVWLASRPSQHVSTAATSAARVVAPVATPELPPEPFAVVSNLPDATVARPIDDAPVRALRERVTRPVALPGGLTGELYPDSPYAHAGQPVGVTMHLRDAQGAPASAYVGAEASAARLGGNATEGDRDQLVEATGVEPGTYHARLKLREARPQERKVLVMLRLAADGGVPAPGSIVLDYRETPYVSAHITATRYGDGLVVTVPVLGQTQADTDLRVQVELRSPEGLLLGVGSAEVEGQTARLRFPRLTTPQDVTVQQAVLVRGDDAQLVDVLLAPVRLRPIAADI